MVRWVWVEFDHLCFLHQLLLLLRNRNNMMIFFQSSILLKCPKTGWITTAKSNPQIDKSKNQKRKNCSFFRRVYTPFAWSFFNLVCSCFFKPSSFFFLHSSSPAWPTRRTTPERDLLHQLALSLSLELTILKQLVILQQNSFCLRFEDLWILLPVLLLLLLSSSVASERERTEENKQTKNRRKQMTIARLITKELTTPQLLSTPNLHSKKEWQRITPCCGLDLMLINLRYHNRCASSNATLYLVAEADWDLLISISVCASISLILSPSPPTHHSQQTK